MARTSSTRAVGAASREPAGNTRAIVMVAAGLALVLVVLVAGKATGGGAEGARSDVASGATVGADAASPTTPSTAPSTAPSTTPPAPAVGAGKNPFASESPGGANPTAAYAAAPTPAPAAPAPSPAPAAMPAAASAPAAVAPSSAPVAPAAPRPTVAPPTSAAPPRTPVTNPPRSPKRLTFVGVTSGATPTADLQVDQVLFPAVEPGEVFASTYKLVSIDGRCATFLHGDMRFWMCVGEAAWI